MKLESAIGLENAAWPVFVVDPAGVIRRANPVPPVPADYPAGDQFAFRIPVNFSVGKKQ